MRTQISAPIRAAGGHGFERERGPSLGSGERSSYRLKRSDLILDADREPALQLLDAIRRQKAGIVVLLAASEDGWSAEDWLECDRVAITRASSNREVSIMFLRAYLDWYATQRGTVSGWSPAGSLHEQASVNASRAPGNTCLGVLAADGTGTPERRVTDSSVGIR